MGPERPAGDMDGESRGLFGAGNAPATPRVVVHEAHSFNVLQPWSSAISERTPKPVAPAG